MSEPGPEPAVTLTGGARPTRAALGPTAWAVLEELTLGAERGQDGRLVVTTSVRRLAAVLGLDKDTVARALGRLSSGGFVFRRGLERAANGSCYVVAPIAGLTRVGVSSILPDTAVRPSDGDSPQRPEVGDGARPRRPRQAPSTAGGRLPRSAQLSLLGD
ncbi:MAG: helix-turn-helix domain-containing protein, partial [Actinomycetota bacterium]|nr:helix-turn-helix domain-containing protein [Actinomycetota bacterium]